jgi:hypothetical protein
LGRENVHCFLTGDIDRPSKFVRSPEGKKIQTKLWDETIEVLKAEAPDAQLSL